MCCRFDGLIGLHLARWEKFQAAGGARGAKWAAAAVRPSGVVDSLFWHKFWHAPQTSWRRNTLLQTRSLQNWNTVFLIEKLNQNKLFVNFKCDSKKILQI